MNHIPKCLKKEPLIEVIWQIQFEPQKNQPIGDLLPGLLYPRLKGIHPRLQLIRLPMADIPAQIVSLDPNLRFSAKYRMEEAECPVLFQVGDRILTVNCRQKYIGWEKFKEKIQTMIQLVAGCGLIPSPGRHSLRYLDLLTLDKAPDMSSLQLSLKLGQNEINRQPIRMRMDLPDGDFTHICHIATPAEMNTINGLQVGTLVDTETFITDSSADWETVENQVDHLHECAKALFFERLLTAEAVSRLEPEY